MQIIFYSQSHARKRLDCCQTSFLLVSQWHFLTPVFMVQYHNESLSVILPIWLHFHHLTFWSCKFGIRLALSNIEDSLKGTIPILGTFCPHFESSNTSTFIFWLTYQISHLSKILMMNQTSTISIAQFASQYHVGNENSLKLDMVP